jgi:hypothetical protein
VRACGESPGSDIERREIDISRPYHTRQVPSLTLAAGAHKRVLPRVACGVWRVACGAWRVACGAWRVACGVWRVACGVWRVACGVWRVSSFVAPPGIGSVRGRGSGFVSWHLIRVIRVITAVITVIRVIRVIRVNTALRPALPRVPNNPTRPTHPTSALSRPHDRVRRDKYLLTS